MNHIEENFKEFIKIAYSGKKMPEDQYRQLRNSFYAGAMITYNGIMESVDDEETISYDFLTELDKELAAFREEHKIKTIKKMSHDGRVLS